LIVSGRKLATKYWVFKVKEEAGGLYRRSGIEIYGHRMSDGFWSIREDSEKTKSAADLSQLEKGDHAVFYLVEPGRESRFLGTAILDSALEKLDAEKAKAIIHKDFLDTDQGVFLTGIDKWAKHLSVECLRGKGPFGDGRVKFSPFFKGNLKQLESREDYEIIIQEHKTDSDPKVTKQKKIHFVPKQRKKQPYRA
jgi:hypothetical protein